MKQEKVLKINLQGVLRERLPRLSRFIPRSVVAWMERTICQEQLNGLLEANAGREGADFCRGVFEALDISYRAVGEEHLPPVDDRRVVFVSNHPLGALDGMALIDYVSQRYGGQVWFVVNDLLMHVTPLKPVFLPVNKFGSQSRGSIRGIDEAFEGNDPIIIFPAGLVSRLRKGAEGSRGDIAHCVADLEWKKMFVNKCRQYRRDIVPVFFDAANSLRFYRMARLRKRLRLKFNLEQIYLPSEIFNQHGAGFVIRIGETVRWQEIPPGKDAAAFAAKLRAYVYSLQPEALSET